MNSLRDNEYDDDEIFGTPKIDKHFKNRRIAVRYIRSDIKISFVRSHFFSSAKEYHAKLLDISSKGIAIECNDALPVNKKVTIHLIFKDNKEFAIKAKIIHRSKVLTKQYGIKFDQLDNALGDHLLLSQKNLIFK